MTMIDVDRTHLKYQTVFDILADMADVLRPPERLTVSQAAEKYRYINNPESYVGPWMNSEVPYMVEPMDCLTQREYTAVVFMGPVQSGKTDSLLVNWLAYSVVCDPADMLLIEKSGAAARDFSKRRVDRLHRHSPEVGRRMISNRENDAILTKMYSSGMIVSIGHPAINELSGKPVPRCAATDYDRMADDIDHEGSVFDQLIKRNRSFGSFGMTLAESTPGKPIEDLKYILKTPHEAPPCKGIASLYNRGDRRRFYWPCPRCLHWFEPDFDLLVYPTSDDIIESGEAAYMQCPACENQIQQSEKYELNLAGVWVRDGQKLLQGSTPILEGTPFRSDIASFWAKGVVARYATWKTLVINYIKARQEFERTGSEEALKVTVTQDQAKPFRPQTDESERNPEDLKALCEDLGEKVVPDGVHFLLALVDVQKNMFVVHIHGIGVGMDQYLVDRFQIRKSNRVDVDDPTQKLWVKPATYLEDWDLLIEDVLSKTYALGDNSGRRMMIKAMAVDSGGYATKKTAGVTNNAYTWWRNLRDSQTGAHRRVILLKGDHVLTAPRTRISHPDSQNGKGAAAGARGEIPVLMINVNIVKDKLNAMLDSTVPRTGRIYFPNWTPDDVFTELCVERRTPKGWLNVLSYHNEAWDLFVYSIALCIHLRVEHFDWEKPPGWAEAWDKNDLVLAEEAETPKFAPTVKRGYDLAQIANALG